MCQPFPFNGKATPVQPIAVPMMCKQCRKHFSGTWVDGGLAVCPRCGAEWVKDEAPAVDDQHTDDCRECRVVWISPK
jgi:hypothetical protein